MQPRSALGVSRPTSGLGLAAVVGLLAAFFATVFATSPAGADPWRPQPLERDREIAEALAGGPELIREAAGVYVLTAGGYELARESGNGFNCLVERSQKDAFEPQCYDAEGSNTLLRQVLLRGELLMAGNSQEEVDRQLAAAWADGRLRAPSRPGINYMLSPRNKVPVAPDRVIAYGPHVMFYVPYLTNEDVGGDPRGSSPVFVINEGEPGAYVIVPVGEHGDD